MEQLQEACGWIWKTILFLSFVNINVDKVSKGAPAAGHRRTENVYNTSVHYWSFDDVSNNTSADLIASNDGKIGGEFRLVRGVVGSAVHLASNDSWIDFGPLGNFCINAPRNCSEGFTVLFWLKLVTFARNRLILQRSSHRYSEGFTIWTCNKRKTFALCITVNTDLRVYSANVELELNRWLHLGIKWVKSTESLLVYLNCSLEVNIGKNRTTDNVLHVDPFTPRNQSLVLGASHNKKKNSQIILDEFALWNITLSSKAICSAFNLQSVHGGYSSWSTYSACSVSCGNGTRFRTRHCTNPRPQYPGHNCTELGPSLELASCASGYCAIDGNYTDWSEYGPCSQTCGTGFRQRYRHCTNPSPKSGGKNCSAFGAAVEEKICSFNFSCPRTGNFSKWSDFGPCSGTCGEGIITRKRSCTNPPPDPGGDNCTRLGSSVDSRVCSLVPCPVHGDYSQWSEFIECNKTCGGGMTYRNRSCNNPAPSHGGRGCNSLGPDIQFKSCNHHPCPIDGGYTEWSAWTPCTKSCGGGGKLRTRACSRPYPRHDGKNCSHLGNNFEFIYCNNYRCPIDGGYSHWSEFSPCTKSCGNGTMKRIRTCTNPKPKFKGRGCSFIGSPEEIRICNKLVCPEYSQWSKFGKCSKSCADGRMIRIRYCKTASARFGFVSCSPLGPPVEQRRCNNFPCPIDGGYTSWSDFTGCSESCGNGTQTRFRNCTQPIPKYGGENCSSIGPHIETLLCNSRHCPVYNPWTEFSRCSRSCGRGTRNRTRICNTMSARHGYINCSSLGPSVETMQCNTQPCPIDGGFAPWSRFSPCTKTCANGTKYRKRNCTNPRPRFGGRNCSDFGSDFEISSCNAQPCPIDGGYGAWSEFEPCSRTCDGGRLVRRRYCINPEPRFGGRNCDHLGNSVNAKTCNTQNCPDITFIFTIALPNVKWHRFLSDPNTWIYKRLAETIEYNVKTIVGYEKVSSYQILEFRKGSVIAVFSVKLFTRTYDGITGLLDAFYVDKRLQIGNEMVNLLNLTTYDVPAIGPSKVHAYNITSTTLSLQWNSIPDLLTNGRVQQYRVLCKLFSNRNVSQEFVDGKQLEAHIAGLQPFTNYSFRVAGINQRGVGVDSPPINVRTEESVPVIAPARITVLEVTSHSINLTWEAIPQEDRRGELGGYRLCVLPYVKDNSAESGCLQNALVAKPWRTAAVVTNLKPYTVYSVRIRGFTSKGEGPLSTAVHVRTEEGVPAAPNVVTAHKASSTSIRVLWNPVLPESVHGILRGYNISYMPRASLDNRWVDKTVDTNTTSTIIWGLKRYSPYLVQVFGFNGKEEGVPSKAITAWTDEDVPDGYPESLHGFNQSSTELYVEWKSIALERIHGVLKGYKVFYRRNDNSSAHAPEWSVKTVRPNAKATTLGGLEKFAWYNVRVAAFNSKGMGPKSPAVMLKTSEDVPSEAVIKLSGHTRTKSSILIKWIPILPEYWHGVLLGYKVFYGKLNVSQDAMEVVNAEANTRRFVLKGLSVFTRYWIRVLGFTSVGTGKSSDLVVASTDEDVPSKPPTNLRALNKTNPTRIRINWSPLSDSFYLHGILRGYTVVYKPITIANRSILGEEYSERSVIVGPDKLSTELNSLTTFTRYAIRVSAFTVKGNGVRSEPIIAETCTCHRRLHTNWWINAPYMNGMPVDKPGIIPSLLTQMVDYCCQNCSEYGSSHVDFLTSAAGRPAQKPGIVSFRDSIDGTTEFSFPVFGFMEQTRYSDSTGFVPMVRSPGVAVMTIGDEEGTAARMVVSSILRCWPVVLLCVAFIWLFSVIIWFLEAPVNSQQFPFTVVLGTWEGAWLAFASMTTTGWGDRMAKSIAGRALTMTWIIIGILLVTSFNAIMSAMLTARVVSKDISLYGTEVGAIQNSSEYRLGVRKLARVNPHGKEYTNMEEVYQALVSRQVRGVLLDTYTVGSRRDLFNSSHIRIDKVLDYSSAYGVVLAGDANKLQRCFQSYLKDQRSLVSQVIASNVQTIQLEGESLSVKRSHSLFDPDFVTYKRAVIGCSAVLIFAVIIGAKISCARRMGWIRLKITGGQLSPQKNNNDHTALQLNQYRKEIKEVMSSVISQFRLNCKERMSALRVKHMRELAYLTKLRRQHDTAVIYRGSFHKDSFLSKRNARIKTVLRYQEERKELLRATVDGNLRVNTEMKQFGDRKEKESLV